VDRLYHYSGLEVKGALLKEIAVKDSGASFTIKTARGLEATLKGNLNADGTLAGDFVEARPHGAVCFEEDRTCESGSATAEHSH
jgi:hypothetical protein